MKKRFATGILMVSLFCFMMGCGYDNNADNPDNNGNGTITSEPTPSRTDTTPENGGVIDDLGEDVGQGVKDVGDAIGQGVEDITGDRTDNTNTDNNMVNSATR